MIRTKRWDDPWDRASDGLRILTCRYRPRALPKKNETWQLWWKQLGPSRQLHADYYGKNGPPIGWEEFTRRYLEEMKQPEAQDKIDTLARKLLEGETFTLLCSSACTDPNRCHRTLLKRQIEQRADQLRAEANPSPDRRDPSPQPPPRNGEGA